MVLFGEIKRGCRNYLGSDWLETCSNDSRLKPVLAFASILVLALVKYLDHTSVLGPDVIALTHTLSRIVVFPERGEQLVVRDDTRIKHDENDFGMTCHPSAHLPVRRVNDTSTGVSDCRDVDAGQLPKESFCTPEAAHSEYRLTSIPRIARRQRASVDEVSEIGGDHGDRIEAVHELGTTHPRLRPRRP